MKNYKCFRGKKSEEAMNERYEWSERFFPQQRIFFVCLWMLILNDAIMKVKNKNWMTCHV